MISLEIKKKLIKDLERMPFESQKKVQEYASSLLSNYNQGKSGKMLARFSGILNNEDAAELKQIIENSCEIIDNNEW